MRPCFPRLARAALALAALGASVPPALGQPASLASAIAALPACTSYPGAGGRAAPSAADLATAERIEGAFGRAYPEALVDPRTVERAALAPEELSGLVAYLACVASQPGATSLVPDQTVALFASRRHGRAAFAALDAIARSTTAPPADRTAARLYAAQMRAAIRSPGG